MYVLVTLINNYLLTAAFRGLPSSLDHSDPGKQTDRTRRVSRSKEREVSHVGLIFTLPPPPSHWGRRTAVSVSPRPPNINSYW